MDGLLAVVGVAAVFCLLFRLLKFAADREHRDGHWHSDGDKMRRWVKSSWQYREMSNADLEDCIEQKDRASW